MLFIPKVRTFLSIRFVLIAEVIRIYHNSLIKNVTLFIKYIINFTLSDKYHYYIYIEILMKAFGLILIVKHHPKFYEDNIMGGLGLITRTISKHIFHICDITSIPIF